jgi:hypothetical protein
MFTAAGCPGISTSRIYQSAHVNICLTALPLVSTRGDGGLQLRSSEVDEVRVDEHGNNAETCSDIVLYIGR